MISKNATALLFVWAIVLLCGGATAAPTAKESQWGDDIRGVVTGFVENVRAKAETAFAYDMNKDGQIGKFRSQEDTIDSRQVGGDPNAARRFQISRPRTGRMLDSESAESKATTAPASKIGIRQVGGDPNAAGRFEISRPRTGRMLTAEDQAEEKASSAPRLRQ